MGGQLGCNSRKQCYKKKQAVKQISKLAAKLAIPEVGYIVYLNSLPTNYDTLEVLLTQQIK